MSTPGDGAVHFELFTSSFCGACRRTRAVLDEAIRLVPGITISEHDTALEPERAEEQHVAATPTVIVRAADGAEVFRAAGVPIVDQVLAAAALTLDRRIC